MTFTKITRISAMVKTNNGKGQQWYSPNKIVLMPGVTM